MSDLKIKTTTPFRQQNIDDKIQRVTGGIIGYMAHEACLAGTSFVNNALARKVVSVQQSLTKDQFQKVTDSVGQAFKNSNLDKCGVEIVEASKDNKSQIKGLFKKEFESKIVSKFLPKKTITKNIENKTNELLKGQNACYLMSSNKILLPKDNKLNLATFHEIGHALNSNASKFGKALQKSRILGGMFLPILIFSLCKDKKQEGEKPKNKLDKAGDFIKNNAGKISFLCYTPLLIEEGLASFKGNKMASELLNPDLAKKVKTVNAFGFLTYVLIAAGTALGVTAANKIRDNIVQNTAE